MKNTTVKQKPTQLENDSNIEISIREARSLLGSVAAVGMLVFGFGLIVNVIGA